MKSTIKSFLQGDTDIEVSEVIDILKSADDQYTNEGDSFLTDSEYDSVYLLAKSIDPTNVYFIGVGSDSRVDKIKLPYPMGSLDQIQVGELEDYVAKKKLKNSDFIISDKMDGISVLLVYDEKGELQIALTRGNGVEGQDITRHVKFIPGVPSKISGKCAIRAELEFSETDFNNIKDVCLRKGGEQFKNARNAIAGLVNNKEVNETACNAMTLFAYEIMGHAGDKSDQMLSLQSMGFKVVEWILCGQDRLRDNFLSSYINERKQDLDYAIDGVVIEVNDVVMRNLLCKSQKRDTLNPAYAIKYKVMDAENIAEAVVNHVEWNDSKHGVAKPKIKLEPFDLQGVTISNATGFNAKYIKDHDIGKGTVVRMTRSGDVIPYIVDVIRSTTADMPENIDEYEWSETGVDLILKDSSNNETVLLKKLSSWATALEIPNLKEGSIQKLMDAGVKTPAGIVLCEKETLLSVLGKNGGKVYDGINKAFKNIPIEKLMGSYPSFGAGVGQRKIKQLMAVAEGMSWDELYDVSIDEVDGWEKKTFDIFVKGLPEFIEYYQKIQHKVTLEVKQTVSDGKLIGEKICFTGFRDKDLQALVESEGGEIVSGVSKKTTMVVAVDPDSSSGKLKKAKDLNIKIISKSEMEELVK